MLDAAQTHHKRACDFLAEARHATSPEDKARYLASATENAVAIVEGFLSQASVAEQVRQLAWSTLPRYRLLKRFRVHEFHRRPVPFFPPELTAKVKVVYMQGPIQLRTGTTPNSAAIITIGPQGLECHISGPGSVNRKAGGHEKELCIIDGELVDEIVGDRVSLEVALDQYLDKVPEFLAAVSSAANGRENANS